MVWHSILIGIMFDLGELTYMAMRAHFQVTGPRPLARNFKDYIARCWGPLVFRLGVENALYWIALNPVLAEAGLKAIHMPTLAFYCTLLRFVPTAYMAGCLGDVFVDFAVVKTPWLKDWWPQMPDPLPQPIKVESAIVETKITELATRTTTQETNDTGAKN